MYYNVIFVEGTEVVWNTASMMGMKRKVGISKILSDLAGFVDQMHMGFENAEC